MGWANKCGFASHVKVFFTVTCLVQHGSGVEGLHCKCQRIETVTSHSIKPVETFRRKVTRCTERVILKGQNISEIPKDAFVNLPCLGRLQINNTMLTEIYYGILNGTNNLETLSFTFNRVSVIQSCSFICLGKLKYLSLDHNKLQNIKVKQFEGLKYLKALYLNNNEIATIDEGSFDSLTELRNLYIENNKLRYIHQHTFKGPEQLGQLWLNNNEIIEIEQCSFFHLRKLIELQLYQNNFTTIDKYTIMGLSGLSQLILSESLQNIASGTFSGSYEHMYLEISGEDFPLLTWRVFGEHMNNERKLPNIFVDGSNVTCSKANCWMKFYYQEADTFIVFNPDIFKEVDQKYSVASIPVYNTLTGCLLSLKSSCPGRGLCNLTVTECINRCNSLGHFTGNVTVDDIRCPFQTFCNCLCPNYYSQMIVCDYKCGGKGLGIKSMDSNECPQCIGCVKCINCDIDCNDTSFYREENVNTAKTSFDCKKSCLECHIIETDDLKETLIPALLVPTGIVIIICIIVFSIYRLWQHKHRGNLEEELSLNFGYQGDLKLVLLLSNVKLNIAEEVKKCWIVPKSFTLGHLLGHGNFGTVWSGTYYQGAELEMEIAIKKIKGINDVEDFLQEATIMRQFSHPNVLSLIGVSVHEDKPCILLPLMDNGALKSYLLANRSVIPEDTLLMFALGVAKGMEYLADQKYVHRDLAARNCMLDRDLLVKIADFGLTRDVYESEYYKIEDQNKGLPIRWMSIEAIRESVFTTKSDMWSYGVLLWEIYTFGAQPYQGLQNVDIEQYLMQGQRLSQPAKASSPMYTIMCSCWDFDPECRPNFTNIKEQLNKIADKQKDYLEVAPSTISKAFNKDHKETLKEGEAPPVPMRRLLKAEVRKARRKKEACSETDDTTVQTTETDDTIVQTTETDDTIVQTTETDDTIVQTNSQKNQTSSNLS